MSKEIEIYKFKKGEKVHLDTIYHIQGLSGGQWWQAEVEEGDDLIIQENIEIKIIVKR